MYIDFSGFAIEWYKKGISLSISFTGRWLHKRYHMGVKNESKSNRLRSYTVKTMTFTISISLLLPAWPFATEWAGPNIKLFTNFLPGLVQYYLNAVSKSFYCLWYELKLLTKHQMLVTSGFQISAGFHYNQKSASLYIYIPITYVMEGMIIYLFICAYLV